MTAQAYRDYYARRALTLRIDARLARAAHRPDIAATLRRVARDYLAMARFAALKVN